MTTKSAGAAAKTAKKAAPKAGAKKAKAPKAAPKKAAKPAAKPKAAKAVKKVAPKVPRAPKPKKKPAVPAGPAAMNKRRQQRFRPMLLDKHQALVRAYSTSKGGSDVGSDGTEDYIDYAVSSYTREFALSLSEMERKQLRLVEEALRRIDRGEYGSCLNCGNPIPEPRLEVEPWASYCIRCQELDELGLLEEREREQSDDDDVYEDDVEEIKDEVADIEPDDSDASDDDEGPGGDDDDSDDDDDDM